MTPKLEDAEYVAELRIRLRFADGTEGEVDLAGELWGEVFAPLRDIALFRRSRLDAELNTIGRETGADLAPECLYEKAAAQPVVAADGPSPPAERRARSPHRRQVAQALARGLRSGRHGTVDRPGASGLQ